ncbi:fluoride efflux transporter CrcB [Labedella populi]|uniref:Fluoride-specific ion channel FluC n=1 Tax=Labedella populi TaxID=2498850 RepID=A0A444QFP4_9MICO|nr:fluoride efflux transporter CrcB [Labedella populi]RWZ68393.1 fluoride efflux transporter CrcB [Labedella populi]
MTPLSVLLVAVGGGVGAALRLIVDSAVLARRPGARFPRGTIVVNISGSFVIGVVAGITAASMLPVGVAAILTTGVLGGYTTFSSASLDAVALISAGKRGAAVVYAGGTLVLSVIAAAVGLAASAIAVAAL